MTENSPVLTEKKEKKNEIPKIALAEWTKEHEKTYNLTKEQALDIMHQEGISEVRGEGGKASESTLMDWCRKGIVDALKIGTGPIEGRHTYIREESLRKQIARKKAEENIDQLLEELEQLRIENKKLRAENREMKKAGYKVPKPSVKPDDLEDWVLLKDSNKAAFNYDRAKHYAFFDLENKKVTKIERRGRGQKWNPVKDKDLEKAIYQKLGWELTEGE